MFPPSSNPGVATNTSYKVVVPFYLYASVAFFVATLLLFFSSSAFVQHYFHPQTLAVTHLMALGWGTMMILGASHQLVPVLIAGKLHSDILALLSFATASIGIPLLVYAFYHFNFGWPAQWGGILVNAAILFYLINIAISMAKSKKENVHAVFVFTGTLWLFITILIGLLLVYNFSYNILSEDSLHYLPLHAHIGIIGWFLLLVLGVGSRLIPMFLISKYDNVKLLWWIYGIINIALLTFVVNFLYLGIWWLNLVAVAGVFVAILCFARFCYKAYQNRLRKRIDNQMKVSFLSVNMMMVPLIFLVIIILLLSFSNAGPSLILAYGFCIFFGWITAMIFGMTFKTLPFILWNKNYHTKASAGKTPNPRDLFSNKIFIWMVVFYISGFVLFLAGVLFAQIIIIQISAILLIVSAIFFNTNVFKMIFHKPKKL